MAKGSPLPQGSTFVSDQDVAAAQAAGGHQFLGGFDITALIPENIFSGNTLRRLKRADVDVTKPVRLDELRALGISLEGKSFTKDFGDALRQSGALTRRGTLGDQAFLERLTADKVAPETGQDIKQGAVEALTGGVDLVKEGMALVGGNINDPLAQQVLRNVSEIHGKALSAHGIGTGVTTGAGAFAQAERGLDALQSFGMNMIGAGAQGVAIGHAVDPFLNPQFSLARSDLAFQQDLFGSLWRQQRDMTHRAARQQRDPFGLGGMAASLGGMATSVASIPGLGGSGIF